MTSNPMNTTTQNTTHRRVTGTRRLTALSAVGLMALTGVAAAPATAAPDASEAPASISQPAAAQYIAVNQFATGLDTAAVDCGPAGAVSAMLAESHTPRGWDAANPAQAVAEVRKDVGHAGATVEADMARALQAQGVTVDTSTDFTGALDQAREGKTAMMNGYMTALPYQYASGNPPRCPLDRRHQPRPGDEHLHGAGLQRRVQARRHHPGPAGGLPGQPVPGRTAPGGRGLTTAHPSRSEGPATQRRDGALGVCAVPVRGKAPGPGEPHRARGPG